MKSIYGDGVKSDETTIISSGVKIEGTVTTNGNIRVDGEIKGDICLLYTSPSPRDRTRSRMPSSA